MFGIVKWTIISLAAYGLYRAGKSLAAPAADWINPFTDELKRLIFDKAIINKVPPALVLATIRQESNFNPYALRLEPDFFQRRVKINPTYEYAVENFGWNETNFGSYGLGGIRIISRELQRGYQLNQILLSTAWDLGWRGTNPNELYDIETNLELMTRLIKNNIHKATGGSMILDDNSLQDVICMYNSGQPKAKAPMITVTDYLPRILKFYGEFSELIKKSQAIA